MITDISVLGDAVHKVLVHLAQQPLGYNEDFEQRISRIEATTAKWHSISPDHQERIRIHWRFIAELYNQSHSVWLEEEGCDGKKPDMTRRMKDEWHVIEFKISDTQSLRQHSRRQVRDMMTKLIPLLSAGAVVKGYRIFLPIDLSMPPDPVWKEITLSPAS